jgi:hypothetical protein
MSDYLYIALIVQVIVDFFFFILIYQLSSKLYFTDLDMTKMEHTIETLQNIGVASKMHMFERVEKTPGI